MVYLIAEIGVNWNGKIDLVKEMIFEAKNAGCNAVKFQSFSLEQVKEHPLKESLLKSSINSKTVKKIFEITNDARMDFICTPMYSNAVKFLKDYVSKFKIREYDGRQIVMNQRSEIFEKILDTGKEIIISSEQSPENCNFYNNSKISWLYCVPKYPCTKDEVDFTKLDKFDGYSNHCPDIQVPIKAAHLGAKIIEVHITSNKNEDFIDNNVSFDYNELRTIINTIKNISKN